MEDSDRERIDNYNDNFFFFNINNNNKKRRQRGKWVKRVMRTVATYITPMIYN